MKRFSQVSVLDYIWTRKVRDGVVLCLIAGLAVALVGVVSSRLHLNVATIGFLDVIVVVLISRTGGFVSSILASILATLALLYIAPPNYSLRVSDPLDVVAITTFLITSLVIARLVSKLRQIMDEARSTVSRRLVDAEERERTRIARELHDDIDQRLALLAVNLEGLKQNPPSLAAELQREMGKASKQVEDLARDVQALSHRLHSSKLEYLGLEKAAASLCRDFSDRQGAQIDFHSENISKELPKEISLCLFRVLQEALQNAIKHSGSPQFQVSLRGGDKLELTIHDSGIGFDPEQAMRGDGLGLTSMKERLKLVNGDFRITSDPQRGTTIQASAPLTPRAKAVGAAT